MLDLGAGPSSSSRKGDILPRGMLSTDVETVRAEVVCLKEDAGDASAIEEDVSERSISLGDNALFSIQWRAPQLGNIVSVRFRSGKISSSSTEELNVP